MMLVCDDREWIYENKLSQRLLEFNSQMNEAGHTHMAVISASRTEGGGATPYGEFYLKFVPVTLSDDQAHDKEQLKDIFNVDFTCSLGNEPDFSEETGQHFGTAIIELHDLSRVGTGETKVVFQPAA